LRNRRFNGFKFRRQHPVGEYVLDFYCHEARLGVELDGGQHNEASQRRKDEARSSFLAGEGITVIRFWNNDVLRETEGVMEELLMALSPALSRRERGKIEDFRREKEEVCGSVPRREKVGDIRKSHNPFPSPCGRGIMGEGKRLRREKE